MITRKFNNRFVFAVRKIKYIKPKMTLRLLPGILQKANIFNSALKISHVRNQIKLYSTATEASKKMTDLLRSKFPKAKEIEVIDISHGCGAMYEINVQSTEFKGLSIVKQHRLITEILKEEIKDMHGLRIQTSIPSKDG